MNQEEIYERMEMELDEYYTSFDPDTERLTEKLARMEEETRQESALKRKSRMHTILAEECSVHLFRTFPFYFEMSSGRKREDWGGLYSGVGTFFHRLHAEKWVLPYQEMTKKDREEGFLAGNMDPVGNDHHCPNYDDILKYGLNGIIEEAEKKLAECQESSKCEFYRAVIQGNRALIHLAERFAKEAERRWRTEKDPQCLKNLRRIAKTAARIPAGPPESFYEALETIIFVRECVGSLEGIGISTFGQLDRLLGPYYERDLEKGSITEKEAKGLLRSLLLYTDARFGIRSRSKETSTTIVIGGCDREGIPVFNEVTRMILEAECEGRYIGTKINARISSRHPEKYIELLGRVQLEKLPVIVFQNDDVIINARVKRGQTPGDSRLYVSGGCHEVVSAGTEVCTRADTWINLPRILLAVLDSETDFPDYESFYRRFLDAVRQYHERIVKMKNQGEACWGQYNPMPLYSSSIRDCLEKGKDITEGGARYSTTALSMVGAATLIDSLYSVKMLVYKKRTVTLSRLKQILKDNYEGEEAFRQFCINRIVKHGTNHEETGRFAAEVLHDLSGVSGQKNGRGGAYYPAFYGHDLFRALGRQTGATPDGRKAGEYLSRGISPSEFVKTDGPAAIIKSLKAIDFTDYVDSFVTELTLPYLDKKEGIPILTALIRCFLEAGGSSLQFNLLDREMMIDAQKHPERHRDLIVRVCGYSEVFVNLDRRAQEEVMARAVR